MPDTPTSEEKSAETRDATPSAAPPSAPKRRGFIRRLYDWVLHWADTRYGSPALTGIAFAESSFFPIPPDPLLMALALGRPQRALVYALLCTVGSVLGGLFGYWIGHAGMESVGYPILDAYGYRELFLRKAEEYEAIGFAAVFLAALSPIPYKVFTIASGAAGMALPTFLVASVLGRGLRFFLLGLLVRFFGDPVKAFIDRYFNILVTIFAILLIAGFAVIKWLL